MAFYKDIETLRERQDIARKHLTEIEEASENAWNDLKIGAETMWLEMEKSVKSAITRFN